ncbi:MAG: substrate-binding domain-containing protein [Bacteroidota bacterium]
MKRRSLFVSLIVLFVLVVSACSPAATPAPTSVPPTQPPAQPTQVPPTAAPAATEPAKPANPNLILATTTSTQDSGLLDVLIPMFQDQTGYTVKTVAVGSGQAMQMGQEGNADVLLVHSPAAEKDFMSQGWGKERELIMHNDFVIVGPATDPAKVKGLASTDAFKAIGAAQAPFVARADKSGTSTKELGIWKKAGLDPATEKPLVY